MELISKFGSYSGFKINWDKSTLLPLDPLVSPLPSAADQIKVVDTFRYLGIVIHPNLELYVKLNINPLIKKFQEKTASWIKLPLSVVGRCNLIKMVWGPQLLYALHNAPIWIPIHIFKKCNTIFRSLIWRKQVPRIKLETLQEAKDSGGLAVPNPYYYFIAAQLQHLTGWQDSELSDPASKIICTLLSNGGLVECLEAGEFRRVPEYKTLVLIDKIWNKAKQHFHYEGYSEWSRIWNNSNFPELCKLKGFSVWSRSGVVYIKQLYQGGLLRDFQSLREEYGIPNVVFFQYLQLRHAISAQTTLSKWELTRPTVLTQLVNSMSRIGQISSIYESLIMQISKTMSLKCRTSWGEDIGHITDEEWSAIMETVPKVSLSSSQKLTQLFIIHRTYRTPYKLYKWNRRDEPFCPRCKIDNGTLIHMLWKCPKLQRYWSEIISSINKIWNLTFVVDPKLCLLGWLDEELYTPHTYRAITRMLFIARKLIAKKWLSVTPPTHAEWVNTINETLLREKLTYQQRGSPAKFERIWDPWLEVPGLAPFQLVQNKILGGRTQTPTPLV